MTNVETRFLSVDGQTGSQLLQSGVSAQNPLQRSMSVMGIYRQLGETLSLRR